MAILFANNASGTLSVSLALAATELTLESGEGINFPSPSGSDYFMATIEDTNGVIEVCKCTSRTGDALTVTRAQEGTAAAVFAAGARVELRVTKGTLEAFMQAAAATITADLDLNGKNIVNGNLSTSVTFDDQTPWHAGNFTPGAYSLTSHTHAALYAALAHTHATSDIDSGTFADARIAASNVTQHKDVLSRITSTTQTGATYTLDANDINTKVRYTGTANSEFTFPSLGAVGDVILITNASAYNLTVTPSGITFNTKDDVATVVCSVKHGVMGFHCVDTNVWEVTGTYD